MNRLSGGAAGVKTMTSGLLTAYGCRRRCTMAHIDDEPRKKPTQHEIGQDLSALSLHELAERIALLQAEIARLEAARTAKSASMTAASAFFKS